MDRRRFLELAALSGLAVVTPVGRRRAFAQTSSYDGPFWVMINAGGGWDPTLVCDPKGDPINRTFQASEIKTVGAFKYAPTQLVQNGTAVFTNESFFTKYANRLMVINGVDTRTNNHDAGSRATWSGKMTDGFPAFAALVAGGLAREKPMAFISNGGYDTTGGIVPIARISDTNTLVRIAYPNRVNPDNADQTYHKPSIFERIMTAQARRMDASLKRPRQLPIIAKNLGVLHTARLGDKQLEQIADVLPDQLADSNGNPLAPQAQLSLAAYKAGLAVSVNLDMGGFDTHGNHDNDHIPRIMQLMRGVDFVMDEAQRLGIQDRVVVVVGSDFARTPNYNEGNGKDHWPVTSMLLMGPGIPGGRLVGETTAMQEAIDHDGVHITPEHVHAALRNLAGISGSELARQYPLTEPDVGLFA